MLMARGDGPYKVVQKVGENAYKIELPREQIFATFNVGDLTSYFEDDKKQNEDLRANPLQQGEVDAVQTLRLDLLSPARILNQVDLMLTLGQGLGSLGSPLTWDP